MDIYEFRELPFQSAGYLKTLQLRDEVLRKPLGMGFTSEQLSTEKSDWHLALFDQDLCVACCVLTPVDNYRVKLRQMAVLPEVQGNKLGSRLLREAESFALSKGFSGMVLHARAYAIPFYEKAGYQTRGGEFTEVGLPHFLMEKVVSGS
jgi:predicted GNAT family N-acyltransferase